MPHVGRAIVDGHQSLYGSTYKNGKSHTLARLTSLLCEEFVGRLQAVDSGCSKRSITAAAQFPWNIYAKPISRRKTGFLGQ